VFENGSRPRLREGLDLRRSATGARHFLFDAARGLTHFLDERDVLIARAINGRHTVSEIARIAQAQRSDIGLPEVNAFISKLTDNGLLLNGSASTREPAPFVESLGRFDPPAFSIVDDEFEDRTVCDSEPPLVNAKDFELVEDLVGDFARVTQPPQAKPVDDFELLDEPASAPAKLNDDFELLDGPPAPRVTDDFDLLPQSEPQRPPAKAISKLIEAKVVPVSAKELTPLPRFPPPPAITQPKESTLEILRGLSEAPPAPVNIPPSAITAEVTSPLKPFEVPREKPRWMKAAGTATGVLMIAALLPLPGTVEAPSVVLPSPLVEVHAKTSGKLFTVLAETGATVREGQPLAVLDDGEIGARYSAAKKRAEALREKAALMQRGAQPSALRAAEEQVLSKERDLELAKFDLDRRRRAAAHDAGAVGAIRSASNELDARAKELALSKSELEVMRRGRDRDALVKAVNEAASAEAELREIGQALAPLTTLSPISGRVIEAPRGDHLGREVEKDESIFSIADTDHAWIAAIVQEESADGIEIGQPILISIDGVQTLFASTVDSISPPVEADGKRVVRVSAKIGNTGALVAPEMGGRAEITTGRKMLISKLLSRL
jgi:HlyD family secretion protein